MENSKNFKLNTQKDIKRVFKYLFNTYHNNSDYSDTKYKNQIYSLNVYSKILNESELENRIEKLEKMLNESEN